MSPYMLEELAESTFKGRLPIVLLKYIVAASILTASVIGAMTPVFHYAIKIEDGYKNLFGDLDKNKTSVFASAKVSKVPVTTHTQSTHTLRL
jgi:hypothetical protein